MNLLFLTGVDFAKPSGAQVATSELLNAFAQEQSVSLEVVALRSGALQYSPLRSDLSVHWLEAGGGSLSRMWKTAKGLRRLTMQRVAARRPDFAVVRQSPLLGPAVSHLRSQGIPVLMFVRGFPTWGDRSRLRDRLVRWLLAWLSEVNFRRADRVYAAFEEVVSWVARARGGHDGIALVPNAVNAAQFPEPDPAHAVVARAGLGFQASDFVVGFVGGLQARHRLESLLSAVSELQERIPEIKLLLVGDGPERAALQRLAETLGIAGRVVWTGFVPHAQVAGMVSACDVMYGVVSPDEPSNPIKCYEYLAAGRPFVGSARVEMRFAEALGCAVLIQKPEAREVAGALAEFAMMSEPERARRGNAGREYVLANHTWEAMARRALLDGQTLAASTRRR